jgi:hypothetical protein
MNISSLRWAMAAGATALSLAALPAQAASVFSTTSNVGGNVEPAAAYRIEGLTVGSTTYNVDFEHGEFINIFPSAPQYFANADAVGEAIVSALRTPTALFVNGVATTPIVPITRVIDQLTLSPDATFGRDVVAQFHIPLSPPLTSGGNHFLSVCEVGGVLTTACGDQPRDLNGQLMYAKFSAADPGGGGTTPVPTPALLPGLLGMGAAMLRRRNQAQAADGIAA